MIQKYNGVLGNFEYDDEEFELKKKETFWGTESLHYIGKLFKPILPKGCTSCAEMFQDFEGEYLDFSEFNTEGVVDMTSMFRNCQNLKRLDLFSFDTSNVESMDMMFQGCTSLVELNISSFDTGKVFSAERMFCNCKSLRTLDISNFDMSYLLFDNKYTFSGCASLKSIVIPRHFKDEISSYLKAIITNCNKLVYIDTAKADVIVEWLDGIQSGIWGIQ